MEKSKEIGLAITEIQVKVLTQSESLSAYELNNIKIKARTLYEVLCGYITRKRREKIETIHSYLDSAISWIEHLADGQDSRFRR